VFASIVGVDNLEEHLRQKRLKVFGHVRSEEEVEIMNVGVENRTKETKQASEAMD